MHYMENTKLVEWILRIGVAGEFLGHGLLAVGGKKSWIGWIANMIHVDAATAGSLLLAIGILDVAAAIIILVKPVRPVLIWMAAWGFLDRARPPLVGLGWLDFIERFANWAAPLALYYVLPGRRKKK